MPRYTYKKIIRVYCKGCQDWINEDDTEFVDISEGMQGEDRLTFICNECKMESTSNRVG
jgi:RNase P subunit RPR2